MALSHTHDPSCGRIGADFHSSCFILSSSCVHWRSTSDAAKRITSSAYNTDVSSSANAEHHSMFGYILKNVF